MQTLAEVHYKVRWRARGGHPGHHPSTRQGGGLEFRHHVPLIDAPDPRRFDVHASLRDPFGQIQVRVFQQKSAIPVFAIADLSASMRIGGAQSKIEQVAAFVASLGYSASRSGDAFGVIGCAEAGLPPLYVPPSVNPAAALAAAAALRRAAPPGRHADGLLAAAELVGARRALVFLLSDFHLPFALIERVLASLAYHDVVPVVLAQRAEVDALPAWGLARVRDPESGRQRLLVLRPSLQRRIRDAARGRQTALFNLCSRHGRAPLVLQDGFSADDVTRYFYG
jgi:uncharacterized protein (DUF58 family)